MGNALQRTLAGRENIAKDWLQAGFIKNPDEYLQVYNTGKLEPIIEDKLSEMLLIRSENEMLADGKKPLVMVTDNHPAHIVGHNTVGQRPDRENLPPEVAQVTTEHIQEHIESYRTLDPILAQILGYPPPPPPPMPQEMPMGQPPSEQGAPPGNIPPIAPQGKPPQEAGPNPAGVKLPTNKLTGKPFNLQNGGL